MFVVVAVVVGGVRDAAVAAVVAVTVILMVMVIVTVMVMAMVMPAIGPRPTELTAMYGQFGYLFSAITF